MKKSLTLLALVFATTGTFAQDLTSKKGEPILPEAGDIGIGIDATPFLDYAGNFFGKTSPNNAPTWNFLNSVQTINFRYFTDAKTALRAQINLGFGGPNQTVMVDNRMIGAPSATANGYPNVTPEQVENKWKQSSTTFGISAGMEMRRGKTRLQGYYGAEIGFYLATKRHKFDYGNALAVNVAPPTGPSQPQNVNPTAADAFSGANNSVDASTLGLIGANTGPNSARATVIREGTVLSTGLRLMVGAEYFMFPKISLGGEFGWGVGLTTQGASKTTWETTGSGDGVTDAIGETEVKGTKTSTFQLSTDNNNGMWGPYGTLRLNFYF